MLGLKLCGFDGLFNGLDCSFVWRLKCEGDDDFDSCPDDITDVTILGFRNLPQQVAGHVDRLLVLPRATEDGEPNLNGLFGGAGQGNVTSFLAFQFVFQFTDIDKSAPGILGTFELPRDSSVQRLRLLFAGVYVTSRRLSGNVFWHFDLLFFS